MVLVVLAGGLRLARLDEPGRIYFDELYYVGDAQQYLERGVEEVRPAHPPVGKWLIAAGIVAAGDDPFGWRIAAALAGTLTVLATYLIGIRLFRRRLPAALAALFVAVDGLAFTMSRIGMLEAFLGLFVALAAWLLLVDRDDPATRWRLLAGMSLGLAIGTKWSGVLALAVAVAILVARDRSPRRVVVPLLVVPAAVYVLGYTGWFVNYERTEESAEQCEQGRCGTVAVDRARGWVDEQGELVSFHLRLEPDHPYRSPAWRWPLLQRPVLTYYERCPRNDGEPCEVAEGNRARVVGLGNPVLWWGFAVATPALGWWALRRRDPPARFLLAFAVGLWAPWLLTKPGYLFYLLPAVPFVALGLAAVLDRLPRARLAAMAAVAALAVAAFAFWYPVWAAVETSKPAQDQRMWFDSWR
ncbi:MAG: phospholipid carrier-dependent glycosyltransferase [Acidimicrobiia bacterium]|nr:phospholipid carrier-dependent glycosyltransferase [Acidimicrobiia bacterium]